MLVSLELLFFFAKCKIKILPYSNKIFEFENVRNTLVIGKILATYLYCFFYIHIIFSFQRLETHHSMAKRSHLCSNDDISQEKLFCIFFSMSELKNCFVYFFTSELGDKIVICVHKGLKCYIRNKNRITKTY